MYSTYLISRPVEMFWIESRKLIIGDLRRLGAEVNQIPAYRQAIISSKT